MPFLIGLATGWAYFRPSSLAILANGLFLTIFVVALLTMKVAGRTMKVAGRRRVARSSGLCENRTLIIDPDGLRLTIPNARLIALPWVVPFECPWHGVRKVESREGYLFFWFKGRARLVVPRAAFADPAQSDAFLQAALAWHRASL